eukprot:2335212-Pleurochrysis_carterae.AAC.1
MESAPVRCNWAATLGPDESLMAGRSTSGYSFMLSDAAIGWGMKKQQSIALSTCEAEIMADSFCCMQSDLPACWPAD